MAWQRTTRGRCCILTRKLDANHHLRGAAISVLRLSCVPMIPERAIDSECAGLGVMHA